MLNIHKVKYLDNWKYSFLGWGNSQLHVEVYATAIPSRVYQLTARFSFSIFLMTKVNMYSLFFSIHDFVDIANSRFQITIY